MLHPCGFTNNNSGQQQKETWGTQGHFQPLHSSATSPEGTGNPLCSGPPIFSATGQPLALICYTSSLLMGRLRR